MKLNLGCGASKIPGYLNVDVEDSCKPDLVHDFTKAPLPFESGVVDEVLLFHTIEHISKKYHSTIVNEIHRVLRPGGQFFCSFPEFRKCFANWERNAGGQKEFWEATLFGRQLYPSDFHVCIMDSHDFAIFLRNSSFIDIKVAPEPTETYNTIIVATKGPKLIEYTSQVEEDMLKFQLVK